MEASRILIVEDEPKVAAFIQKGLEENGYSTEVAYDGLIGKAMSLSNNYKLIVLDLNLPHINGFQLCRIIRDKHPKVPILMLTALGGIEEKVQGFEAGADDYLLKPFEVKELVLRIRALLKRSSEDKPSMEVVRVADLEIYLNEKKVMRAGKIINLRAKEYQLLEFMALNKNKVLDRLIISENVWGINFDTGTNVIDVYINFLRKKLDTGFETKLIHTRVGLGYVLTENPG